MVAVNTLIVLLLANSVTGAVKLQQKRVRQRSEPALIDLHRVESGMGLRISWETKRKALLAVTGSRDFSYYANINIGGQPFNVALDTGSADLWIQTQNCTSPDCVGASQYIFSSTLLQTILPFDIQYLSGSVSGQIAMETVRLAQYEITSQVFGLATQLQNISFAQIGVSGMLGLGFPSIATISSSHGLPVIWNILANLGPAQQFFAFLLGRDVGTFLGNSSFTIGQHDPVVTDPASLQFIPIYPRTASSGIYDYWKLPIDAIIVNGVDIPLSSSKVACARSSIGVFDTGTSLMLGPTNDVNAVYGSLGQVGSANKNADGAWELDCAVAVNLLIILGGRAYPIHPLDFSWDKIGDGNGRCLGGLQTNDGVVSGDWLFGDTVLRNIYTAHYVETTTTSPLLGLLSLTKPSTALREFISARGPYFELGTGATFSDEVLRISYTSEYFHKGKAQTSGLSPLHDNSQDPNQASRNIVSNFPHRFYDVNTYFSEGSRATVVLAGATTVGFLIGALVTTLMRNRVRAHGHSFTVLKRRDSEFQNDSFAIAPTAGRGMRGTEGSRVRYVR